MPRYQYAILGLLFCLGFFSVHHLFTRDLNGPVRNSIPDYINKGYVNESISQIAQSIDDLSNLRSESPKSWHGDVLKFIQSISNYMDEMPTVGVSIMLPHENTAYRYAAREDIWNLAPLGYNFEPLFMADKIEEDSQLGQSGTSDMNLFGDVYDVTIPGVPVIIRAFLLVKSVSKYRDRVLVLTGDSIVDWRAFADLMKDPPTYSKKESQSQSPISCLVREGEEGCDSFNGIYTMNVVNEILSEYRTHGSDGKNLDNVSEWLEWLKTRNINVKNVSKIMSGMYQDVQSYYRDLMLRDPRYEDLLAMDEGEAHKNLHHIFMRLSGHVMYTANPVFTLFPDMSGCLGENGLYFIETAHGNVENRNLFRSMFKAYGIEEYYFIMGKAPDDDTLRDLNREHKDHKDIIMYSHDDGYLNLIYKTYAALSFAVNYCPDAKGIFKMDDDIIFDPSVLPHTGPLFGTKGGKINWSQMGEITCLNEQFEQNHIEVGRDNLPFGKFSYPYKAWPFDHLPPFCSGAMYGLKMDAVHKILDALKTYNWAGDKHSAFNAATCNEDFVVTGRLRYMTEIDDVKVIEASELLDREDFRTTFEKKLEIILSTKIRNK